MKKNNATILVTTIAISLMLIFFTSMIIFIQNHYGEASDDTASSPVMAADGDAAVLDTYDGIGGILPTESETEVPAKTENEMTEEYDTGTIYTSDKIDLTLDDTAMHDVEYEKSYTDTLNLLPSVYYEHRPVPKEEVSRENFSKSFAGAEWATITFGTSEKEENVQTVSVPSEITLYNVDDTVSNTYKLSAKITGDKSYIKSLGWSTSDSSKLALSRTSGETTMVSRKTDFTGTMVISLVVTYDTGGGMTATERLDTYVHVVDMTDMGARLYDAEGNELYVDKEAKTAAYLKDYAKYDIFYGPMKITGWQEIDGKTYYFNESCWAVKGEQVIGGTKYSFDEDGVLIAGEEVKGIDVSLYQKEIDWEQVAASGIDFAIVRCGFRGAVTGRLVEDACFRRNIEGAKAAGIRVGVYFFTQALDEQEAKEEANMVLSLCRDYSLDLPIFIDSENAVNGRANGLDSEKRTKVIKTFCETISSGGHAAGVYASKSWYYHKLDADELEQYCIWVAQYNTECNYTGKTDYWQYSSKGHINGIEGNVDLDIVMSP